MPAYRGRPTIYNEKTTEVRLTFGSSIYADFSRWATEHGLSVPMYLHMMLNLHRNGVLQDERRLAKELTDA